MLGRYSTVLWLWVIFTKLYLFWKIKPLVVKSPMYFSLEIPPPLLVWLGAFFPHSPHSVCRPFAGNLCQTLSAFFRLIPLPFVWIMLRWCSEFLQIFLAYSLFFFCKNLIFANMCSRKFISNHPWNSLTQPQEMCHWCLSTYKLRNYIEISIQRIFG